MAARSSLTLRQRFRRWALRGRPPEAQPVTLRQARVYVLPTRSGLAVAGTLLVMFVAAINYNLSLGYALIFFLASIIIVHILMAWRTLVALQIGMQASGEAWAGGKAHWLVSFGNAQATPRPALRILDSAGHECLCVDLPPQTTVRHELALPCPRRGHQQPGQFTLETRQPLGWIRAWSYLEPDAPQLVFPSPRGALPLPVGPIEQAESSRGLHTGADDFAGLRAFHPGDSLRHVAWKQLARGQGMLTKTFAGGMATGCVLDWQALPASMPLELRLSQLAQWVVQARQAGLRTTLILPGVKIGPGHDAAHHLACLAELALFRTEAPRG